MLHANSHAHTYIHIRTHNQHSTSKQHTSAAHVEGGLTPWHTPPPMQRSFCVVASLSSHAYPAGAMLHVGTQHRPALQVVGLVHGSDAYTLWPAGHVNTLSANCGVGSGVELEGYTECECMKSVSK